jgi:hypothetical protein
MNQEKTKHKFHEVLKWVADNETIEYKHPSGGKTFEVIPTKQVLEFLAKDNFSHVQVDCFRIKPKITTRSISGTFFLKSATIGRDSSTISLETINYVNIEDFVELNSGLVRIISENWYNELVSCKEQLDKQTLTKGQNK